MARSERTQQSGDSSKNYQAGRDIVVQQGISYTEAREIAMDVFQAALPQLRAQARAIAEERAEEITDKFLTRLDTEERDTFSSLADPDVQVSLAEMQKGYARTGDEELKESLVELLVRRVGEKTGSLRSIALNEAIASTPKLTEEQRKAIAWVFFLRHTRQINLRSLDGFYESLRKVSSALSVDVPKSTVDYQHIEYVGAGAVSVMEFDLASLAIAGVEGLFTTGFLKDEIEPELWSELQSGNLLQPCLRDSNKIQVGILGSADIKPALLQCGLEHLESEVSQTMTLGRMDNESIERELVANVPDLKKISDTWHNPESALKHMTLTSVGIALGYAYWQGATKEEAPLSIWL